MSSDTTPNPRIPLVGGILRAFHWFDRGMLATLAVRGHPELTRAQSLLLPHLEHEGTRSAELARRLDVSRQAVHQTVRELEGLGLVRQEPDPTNRSAKRVRRTPRGERVVAEARATFLELEAELAKRIGAQAMEDLRRALEKDWGEPLNQEEAKEVERR